MGHRVGDAVLAEVSRRLKSAAGVRDVAARTGGDEFIIVLSDMPDKMEIARRASDVLQVLAPPIPVGEHQHFVGASIGISLFPLDGTDPDALLRNADVAMYDAKRGGGGSFSFYTSQQQYAASRKFRIERALRQALARNELSVHYQPILDRGRRIAAVEALLRWNSLELGPIEPAQFVPLADEAGMMVEIGRWAIKHAFEQAAQWMSLGKDVPVWINASLRQLLDRTFLQSVEDLLQVHALPPQLVGFEISETVFGFGHDEAYQVLRALRSWAFASRSAISAFDPLRSRSCKICRSTCSKSIARSSRTSSAAPIHAKPPQSSFAWRARSDYALRAKASKRRSNWIGSLSSVVISGRARSSRTLAKRAKSRVCCADEHLWRDKPHQFAARRRRIGKIDARQAAFLEFDACAAAEFPNRPAEVRLVPHEHDRLRGAVIAHDLGYDACVYVLRETAILDESIFEPESVRDDTGSLSRAFERARDNERKPEVEILHRLGLAFHTFAPVPGERTRRIVALPLLGIDSGSVTQKIQLHAMLLPRLRPYWQPSGKDE